MMGLGRGKEALRRAQAIRTNSNENVSVNISLVVFLHTDRQTICTVSRLFSGLRFSHNGVSG